MTCRPGCLALTLAALFLLAGIHQNIARAETESDITYELAIAFDQSDKKVFGTAHITLPAEKTIAVFLDGIMVTGALLQQGETAPGVYTSFDSARLTIAAQPVEQQLFISYEKEVEGNSDNYIEEEGIALLERWYPQPSDPVLFSLDAELPEGFAAVAESDHLPKPSENSTKFSFSRKVSNIHFIAAPFRISHREVRPGLTIYTYFLDANQPLAEEYLAAASNHLNRYENLIGPYPYNHFAIVENLRPTGYGMPTFTLLGGSVIRLPFIKDTSLGHEILHSWFGNAVGVADGSGNWCEGLTSYLSDWLYRQGKGEGAIARKENILKYHSYVTEQSAIPLKEFRSASHTQPMARAVRSVGYIRGAMLFHELKNFIGQNDFLASIRLLYTRFKHTNASWEDIEETVESITQTSLDDFFHERLTRSDIPALDISSISSNATESTLHLTISQQSNPAFHFVLPVEVKTALGSEHHRIRVSKRVEEITLHLGAAPHTLVVDPQYDLLRMLSDGERVVPLSFFFGQTDIFLHTSAEDISAFAPLRAMAKKHNWQQIDKNLPTMEEIESKNLILAGRNNPLTALLFGSSGHPKAGTTLEARIHPLNPDKSILLVSAGSSTALKTILPRLTHFGKYNYLHFLHGRAVERSFNPGVMGMRYTLADKPLVIKVPEALPLETTIAGLAQKKVVYVGESHTAMGDHLLQYHIIAGLHRHNPDIAIGMEMFPRSSQEALTQFVTDTDMSERTFLKKSNYFDVWSFDYRYYRNIINFAREHQIPILGLNIERQIVSTIFGEGSTSNLNDEQKAQLPSQQDLSLPGYYDKLSTMHNVHMQGGHGSGSLSGFIQAQAVWDEIMAETIAEYILEDNDRKLIVLAGTQHTRKDNGIPPRVARRIGGIDQSVVVSLASSGHPDPAVADYFVFAPQATLPQAGKIGISLAETEKNGDTFLEIEGISPGSNATRDGLRVKDRIVSINTFPVSAMEDIRIAMTGTLPGNTVTVVVERPASWKEPEKKVLHVELYRPRPASPH